MKISYFRLVAASILLPAVLLFGPANSDAQSRYHAQVLDMSVSGTSTLHDWEIKSSKGQCEALITMNKDVVTFSSLSFSLAAESLKSGHSMMDKNTYKALNTENNPNITFALTSASVTPAGNNTYKFSGAGKLTIAGTTKPTELSGILKYNPLDKSFICTGTKTFKMTEYGVKPPTVMMGAIKTGNEISVSYNITIKG